MRRFSFSELFLSQGSDREQQWRCLVYEGHKLIEIDAFPAPQYELYDLENDPGELRNLYLIPEYDRIQGEMLALLKQEFARVDGHHDRRSAGPRKTTRELWRQDFETCLERVRHETDPKTRSAALRRLSRRFLTNRYGEPSLFARRFLGDDRLAEIAQYLRNLSEEAEFGYVRAMAFNLLVEMNRPELRDHWIGKLADGDPSVRLQSAMALARLDDASGAAVLRQALALPIPLDPYTPAVGLGLIGDPTASRVLLIALALNNSQLNAMALDALARLDLEETAPALRDRSHFRRGKESRVNLAILAAVEHDLDDSDTLQILLRFCRSRNAEVRGRSLDLLGSVMNEEELASNTAAADALDDGLSKCLFGDWKGAAKDFERAIELVTFNHVALLLMKAQVERVLGHDRAARDALQAIIDDGDHAVDAKQARGLMADIDRGDAPWIDRETFAMEVVDAPSLSAQKARLLRGRNFAIHLNVMNIGPVGLAGGEILFSPHFNLAFECEDGKVVRDRLPDLAFLPAGGLAPGAAGLITLTARVPLEPVRRVLLEARIARRHYYLPPRNEAPIRVASIELKH